jgi:hypothetical protein
LYWWCITEVVTRAEREEADDTTEVADREGEADAVRVADRVVFSYRAVESDPDDQEWILADSGWIADAIDTPSYRRYVRVAHEGPVDVGAEFEEFVSCGCASPQDVILRVEALESGDAIGEATTVEFLTRREALAETA